MSVSCAETEIANTNANANAAENLMRIISKLETATLWARLQDSRFLCSIVPTVVRQYAQRDDLDRINSMTSKLIITS